ncbi:MAG: FprA family A-type flavoprotein [Clostridia bacterium]|nr:FprA family A-type flavoprotein [Clostridia bacterium]
MHCIRKITEDLLWVGADDRRLAMFEGVYSVPRGVSYNSYLLLDEKTVLMDTVDRAVEKTFLENVAYGLGGRNLDYVIVHHMEPDHSATLIRLLEKYPEATVICNDKTKKMIEQFFGKTPNALIVKEGEKLSFGKHEFTFYMAPMVHWPEVMISFDSENGVLFSADAFGTFGALNGALFSDEVDFFGEHLAEARRYYTNIVGKYGPQVQAALKKLAPLPIKMIAPLHGFVFREADAISAFIAKYDAWSTYTPERTEVMIAYASIYGNTENAANILACRLRERGIAVDMFDVSVTPASEIVAAAFRASHLVFAAPTYNNGVFVTMEQLLHELAAHNLQKRTVALIENGSWAPSAAKWMREILASCKELNILENDLTVKSALGASDADAFDAFAEALVATVPEKA